MAQTTRQGGCGVGRKRHRLFQGKAHAITIEYLNIVLRLSLERINKVNMVGSFAIICLSTIPGRLYLLRRIVVRDSELAFSSQLQPLRGAI